MSGRPPRCSGRACARTGCSASPARSSASSGRTPTVRTRRPRAGDRDGDRVRQGRIPHHSGSRRMATRPRSPGRRPASAPSTPATVDDGETRRSAKAGSTGCGAGRPRTRRLRTKAQSSVPIRRPQRSSPNRLRTPRLPMEQAPDAEQAEPSAPSNGASDGEAIAPYRPRGDRCHERGSRRGRADPG